MVLPFRHFQTRLLVLFLAPLLLVLGAVYYAVGAAWGATAYNQITADLSRTARSFDAAIDSRIEILAAAGDAFSDDFAFKEVYATGSRPTIISAMDNLLGRLGNLGSSSFIAFTRYNDNTVVASTLEPERANQIAPWLPLIERARELDRAGDYPEAVGVMTLQGRPYQLIVLPFLNPTLENWVTVGFEIGPFLTGNLPESIEVSVLVRESDAWRLDASSLAPGMSADLLAGFSEVMLETPNNILRQGGEDFVTLARPLSSDDSVLLVLQRSLTSAMQPFSALRAQLLQIFALGLAVVVAGAVLISRTVTRPVLSLAQGAQRISRGELGQRVELPQRDEIGQLAESFNRMAEGLAEREKVRDLLGKVVSPQVANELMSRDLELGGEERDVTVLFADLRGFTGLCEGRSPQEILSLLNEYFSVITGVIEQHGGVVDKYIGDAVMALFGAPLHYEDAPHRAMLASLEMYEVLQKLNLDFSRRGIQPMNIGVGINTDRVVVGNMGSKSRLNYTAIGDGVNLASRLEGLCRHYGVRVVVSEQTRRQAADFLYLELDKVRVSGRREPVRIYTPLAPHALCDDYARATTAAFADFLQAWYAGNVDRGSELLDAYALTPQHNPVLLALYRERLRLFRASPPDAWDGVFSHTTK